MTGSLLGCCCGRDAGGDNAVKGVPIVPLELFPDSTPGEVLDIVGGCDSIVSGDLNPLPFAGTFTDGKEATMLIGIIKNRNATVMSAVKKILISSNSPSTFCHYILWMIMTSYVFDQIIITFPSLSFKRIVVIISSAKKQCDKRL
jgi:hypothetical protein